jgi:hypothetical protein
VLDRSATIEVPAAGTGFLTLRLGFLHFEASGAYELLVMLDEQDAPAGRHVFEVVLKQD